MKTAKGSIAGIALGLFLLAASVSAATCFITVGSAWGGPAIDNGTLYSVPGGADYEWEVVGTAHILLGGGGLNVNEYGSGSYNGDVNSTSYTDDISYQLNAYDYYNGYALFYITW